MTEITLGEDNQPRFDRMTVKSLADELHQMSLGFADRGLSGSSYMTMQAAAAALRYLSEWQPIETAPRDGKPVLVSHPQDYPRVARYATSLEAGDGAWIVARRVGADPIAFVYADPTHWRPLPPGPDGGGA